MNKVITLTTDQWQLIELCLCTVLSQVEDQQYGFPVKLPSKTLDTKELARVRYAVSFGYTEKGEGVTESTEKNKL